MVDFERDLMHSSFLIRYRVEPATLGYLGLERPTQLPNSSTALIAFSSAARLINGCLVGMFILQQLGLLHEFMLYLVMAGYYSILKRLFWDAKPKYNQNIKAANQVEHTADTG